MEEATVWGFEDTEYECDFLPAVPSWGSPALLSLVEDTAEALERGRWELREGEEVGGGSAEGSSCAGARD